MSLGTCPRLTAITLDAPYMATLDLRGCNELATLDLACPSLRKIDATFCRRLSDDAVASIAACPALEELVLAVCNALTPGGLAALAPLGHLAKLDLSYNALEVGLGEGVALGDRSEAREAHTRVGWAMGTRLLHQSGAGGWAVAGFS